MAYNLADVIFKRNFSNEYVWISIKISMNFVPMNPIDSFGSGDGLVGDE